MIKSSHYNNNISNGSSLIVRVRYVYVHQHEARPFLNSGTDAFLLCSLTRCIPPPLLPHSSILNTFLYAFSRFISALAAHTEAERNLNISRLEAVSFYALRKIRPCSTPKAFATSPPLNVQGGIHISPSLRIFANSGFYIFSFNIPT